MLDKKDIKQIKELLAPVATKKDLQKMEENLAGMVNNAFNENEKRMAEGFKIVNDKLDKKVGNLDGRVKAIEEAIAIK